VREKVDDDVRAGERALQRGLVEDLCFDGAGPEALEQRSAAGGSRDADDSVTS
jgi:hypothetical protein